MIFIGGISDQDVVLLDNSVGQIDDSQKSEFPVVDGGKGSVIPVEMMGTGVGVDSESVIGLAFFRVNGSSKSDGGFGEGLVSPERSVHVPVTAFYLAQSVIVVQLDVTGWLDSGVEWVVAGKVEP